MTDQQSPDQGEEHPYFTALKAQCAAKPEAVEDHPWGETVFKVRGKVFAFLGMSDRASVTVKPHADDLDGLLAFPFIERAPYIGRYGWVSVRIADDAALEMAQELVDTSFEIIGAKTKKRRTE